MDNPNEALEFGIVGAGPAGLSAAWELSRRGRPCVVFEQDAQVGGLSKTVNRNGYRFDIGGHRFFTKSPEVEALWHEALPADFLRRSRRSRIYYRGKFFSYPLKPMNALFGLGLLTSLRVLLSFVRSKVFKKKPERSFEDWVTNRFGRALYRIFFKTYTEKVWGISCRELSADWAAQRIRNLSLGRAVLKSLGIGRDKRDVASLIEQFDYPKLGPGQMYEAMARTAVSRGARIRLGCRVTRVKHHHHRVTAVEITGPEGRTSEVPVEHLVSTMPLSELVAAMEPAAPADVADAARRLRYRSILTVNFTLAVSEVLPDTWVYLHAPEVRAGRLQLYKNWSPFMVPDADTCSVGLEYFCFEDDEFWSAPESQLIDVARTDLRRLDLVDPSVITDAFVIRYPKAYPMYEEGYA
ncbi:MAG TPA: FAD-dependent oxidoreductase, partial [Planctomycetota bacterium]|nr:FAD-dependent oxidoreductase [Planctomycetota bacterium]